MLDTLFIEDFIDIMEQYFHFFRIIIMAMKFSSTDKRSETVSLIRNKKKYFIDRNKCIVKENRVLACFQTRPKTHILLCFAANKLP